MKKKAGLFYMLILAAVLGNAQTIDRSRYREITLPQFEAWKQGVPREGTEPMLFKARVLFEEVSETAISFADPGNQTSIHFTVDKVWPEMEEGRSVTIYFTAGGSWSWNRVLDEIDRGPLPAQDPPGDDPYSGGLASEQEQYDPDQYDQDRYDQTAYGGEEEPDFAGSEGGDQGKALAETETGGEGERASPPSRPPTSVPNIRSPSGPAASPPPEPSGVGASAVSSRITGAAPQPGRVYRLQVGAYIVEKNAARTLNRLKDAGFSPKYERHGQYLRVVLSGVRAADVKGHAERIGRAGFGEVWCREER
ncbi:MAG: SPOR domain-containing protein [Treponema sp.]|jgi:cell division protein FtsN|nr:SPOR domain-containing protein [Treponema sp.]